MQDYLNVLKNNYANFEGRARRREYWMFFLCNIVIGFLCFVLDMGLAMTIGIAGLNLIYMLAVIIPGIAVTIRRLHDTGRSGWWILLGLVPVAGLVLLVFMLMDSQPGDNQWGRNPKGINSPITPATATA